MSATEGWMADKHDGAKVFHYIRETMALCGRYGFYFGDLVPDVGSGPKGNEDCITCFRKLRGQQQTRRLTQGQQS